MSYAALHHDDPDLVDRNSWLVDNLSQPGIDGWASKEAAESTDDFVRMYLREETSAFRVLPPRDIPDSELVKQLNTDEMITIHEREPGQDVAISASFRQMPDDWYIYGSNFPVVYNRLLSPNFVKDLAELRTYTLDVRQVLTDNARKDIDAAIDARFYAMIDQVLVGQDAEVPWTGVAQWQGLTMTGTAGSTGHFISRYDLTRALGIMPSTLASLETATIVLNSITVKDIEAHGRDMAGGDISQEMFRDGWTTMDLLGRAWQVTIKKALVPTGSLYMFAAPKFCGKAGVKTDVTMTIKRYAFLLSYFLWMELGITWANPAACARADFEAPGG